MMPLIERYVLRRATHIFLLTLCALVATLWVTQVLRELDVVTAKGQAIWIFLLMTILALPALIQVVAPIAFLAAAIVTLNGLTNDSELPVIAAAGASRSTINRPILVLGLFVMLGVAFLHHVLAPASLSVFTELLTRVRADLIATLVQDGRFRTVDDGLTMYIRQKAPDGSFRGIFVNDDRDPDESLQYSAAQGMLLQRAGGSFLVLQHGDLIREDHVKGETNIVDFETYALDLSQLGAPNTAAIYQAKERSTLYLLFPKPNDATFKADPRRVAFEVHSRTASPLYALAFAFVALAFLGRPRTNRQDRSFAIAAVVLICLVLRSSGFAAAAVARTSSAAIPFMYAIPLVGVAFGVYAAMHDSLLSIPRFVEAAWDATAAIASRALRRYPASASAAYSERP